MQRLLIVLVVALALIFGVISVSAQADDTPLLRMLARIPDIPPAPDAISFVDNRAVIAARSGVPNVTSAQAFDALSGTPQGDLLMAALNGISSGPTFYAGILDQVDAVPSRVGFDFFAIDRAAEYGRTASLLTILEGNFDKNMITTTLQAQGYIPTDESGMVLLCPSARCQEGGTRGAHDPANPFGGSSGRNQPVIVGDHLVASSPAVQNLTTLADTVSGTIPSLADQADYRAAAEAISTSGLLLQADLISPTTIDPAGSARINTHLTAAEKSAAQDQFKSGFTPLPAYNLIGLGDSATSGEQQVRVGLVYTTQADAQKAADILPTQIEHYISLQTGKPLSDALTKAQVGSVDATVYPASTGRYVTVVTLHAPLPDDSAGGKPKPSSQVYKLLAQAYLKGDVEWLATQL